MISRRVATSTGVLSGKKAGVKPFHLHTRDRDRFLSSPCLSSRICQVAITVVPALLDWS